LYLKRDSDLAAFKKLSNLSAVFAEISFWNSGPLRSAKRILAHIKAKISPGGSFQHSGTLSMFCVGTQKNDCLICMNKIITPNFKKSNNTYIKKEYFVKLTEKKGAES